MARAIESVLDAGRPAYAPALERVAARFRWPLVAAPLERVVLDPAPQPRGRRRARRRPAHALRSAGYRGLRGVLNRLGLKSWPRL
jgi:hypothetical protein